MMNGALSQMNFKIAALTLLTGITTAAFAETPIQATDSIESLSKAKVVTTVNGQPGSLQELLASGKVKVIDVNTAPVDATEAPAASEINETNIEESQPEPVSAPPADDIEAQIQ